MRIACGVEYHGAKFCGWQKQSSGHTVQAVVEQALSFVADHPVQVVCAGRTDSGVHATGQVIHFDSHAERADHAWLLGANVRLPGEVRLLWTRKIDESFHARFSALARQYRYIIFNRPVASAIGYQQVSWERRPLELVPMQAAACHLLGEHDFSSFRAAGCQAKRPVRDIQQISLSRQDDYLYLDIRANAFLHHMVRNIAGALMTVGRGEETPDWVKHVLEQRDRTCAAATAPAHGLYLVGVTYPEQYGLPSLGYQPVF